VTGAARGIGQAIAAGPAERGTRIVLGDIDDVNEASDLTGATGVGGADATRGWGLVGLRDRVEAIGGTMTLDSPAGAGTVLTVRLPVTAEDHLSERTVVRAPARCEQAVVCNW
jgi:NAD(P)-dependent dehydrogenase (short-subunit alcohol dehydrogenase family)